MSISMHSALVPMAKTLLGALSNVLQKGADHAKAKGFDESVLVNSRLAPDMFALARQAAVFGLRAHEERVREGLF